MRLCGLQLCVFCLHNNDEKFKTFCQATRHCAWWRCGRHLPGTPSTYLIGKYRHSCLLWSSALVLDFVRSMHFLRVSVRLPQRHTDVSFSLFPPQPVATWCAMKYYVDIIALAYKTVFYFNTAMKTLQTPEVQTYFDSCLSMWLYSWFPYSLL